MNTRVEFQNNQSEEVVSKQLVDIDNGKISVDTSSECITFPADFCQLTESKTELIEKVFPNIT